LQVRQAALLLNCHQESGQRRTVERSWKQCEECVKLLDDVERHPLRTRLSYKTNLNCPRLQIVILLSEEQLNSRGVKWCECATRWRCIATENDNDNVAARLDNLVGWQPQLEKQVLNNFNNNLCLQHVYSTPTLKTFIHRIKLNSYQNVGGIV